MGLCDGILSAPTQSYEDIGVSQNKGVGTKNEDCYCWLRRNCKGTRRICGSTGTSVGSFCRYSATARPGFFPAIYRRKSAGICLFGGNAGEGRPGCFTYLHPALSTCANGAGGAGEGSPCIYGETACHLPPAICRTEGGRPEEQLPVGRLFSEPVWRAGNLDG